MPREWLDQADRALGALIALGRWLVLPVGLLLFLQWPLRDLFRAYSREANDLAQWLFALYVAIALTEATRRSTHLAAAAVAERYTPALRAVLARAAALLCVAPWSLFVLVAGAPMIWRSIRQLEEFPDTYDPGYFIIKASVWLLALLMLLQAIVDAFRPSAQRH
jgi:TRAP-type mannitol/chloroaromatic compound transport system permease small subunit